MYKIIMLEHLEGVSPLTRIGVEQRTEKKNQLFLTRIETGCSKPVPSILLHFCGFSNAALSFTILHKKHTTKKVYDNGKAMSIFSFGKFVYRRLPNTGIATDLNENCLPLCLRY